LPEVDVIFADDFQVQIGDIKITSLQNYHGINEEYTETHGFVFETPTQNLLFATDLSTLVDYESYLLTNNLKLDIILLEANYDPQVIEFSEYTKLHTGFDTYSNGSYRHLSTVDRQLFIEKFSNESTIDVELHMSARYRSFEGLVKMEKGKISMDDVDKWINR